MLLRNGKVLEVPVPAEVEVMEDDYSSNEALGNDRSHSSRSERSPQRSNCSPSSPIRPHPRERDRSLGHIDPQDIRQIVPHPIPNSLGLDLPSHTVHRAGPENLPNGDHRRYEDTYNPSTGAHLSMTVDHPSTTRTVSNSNYVEPHVNGDGEYYNPSLAPHSSRNLQDYPLQTRTVSGGSFYEESFNPAAQVSMDSMVDPRRSTRLHNPPDQNQGSFIPGYDQTNTPPSTRRRRGRGTEGGRTTNTRPSTTNPPSGHQQYHAPSTTTHDHYHPSQDSYVSTHTSHPQRHHPHASMTSYLPQLSTPSHPQQESYFQTYPPPPPTPQPSHHSLPQISPLSLSHHSPETAPPWSPGESSSMLSARRQSSFRDLHPGLPSSAGALAVGRDEWGGYGHGEEGEGGEDEGGLGEGGMLNELEEMERGGTSGMDGATDRSERRQTRRSERIDARERRRSNRHRNHDLDQDIDIDAQDNETILYQEGEGEMEDDHDGDAQQGNDHDDDNEATHPTHTRTTRRKRKRPSTLSSSSSAVAGGSTNQQNAPHAHGTGREKHRGGRGGREKRRREHDDEDESMV